MSPGAPTRRQVDLTRDHGIGELLELTVALFARNALLLFTLSLAIVAPVVVLVDGLWGRGLHDGGDATPGVASNVSLLLYTFVVPPLISALHAVVVRDLGAGRRPGLVTAVREAGPRLPAAFGAVALAALGIFLGLLALIAPGVMLAVRWAFAAQAAVLEGQASIAAIRRSGRIVQQRWGEVFGALLVSLVLSSSVGFLGGTVLRDVSDGVVYLVGAAVVQTIATSLAALFTTLLYFTMRVRQGLV